MKLQAVLMVVSVALMNLVVYADDDQAAAMIKVDEFSVEPLEIMSGQKISIRWQVRNVGEKAVSLHPVARFTRPGMTHIIKAGQSPQLLAPGQAFTFTAEERFEFESGWGKSIGGQFVIDVMVYDSKTDESVGGFQDDHILYVNIKPPAPAQPTEPQPGIAAYPDRSLYFPDQTVVVRGRVTEAKPAFVSVSGALIRRCPVNEDGTFEFEFPSPATGLHTLTIEAEGLPPARVDVFVTPAELRFPRLFGTDETYKVGIFTGNPREHTPMFPYWSKRLGVEFLAINLYNKLSYTPVTEEMLTRADALDMRIALVGEADCANLPGGGAKSMRSNGKRHSYVRNLLSEKFQQAFRKRVTDLARQLRHHRSFRYILLMPEQFNLRWEAGYDRENLERFAKQVLAQTQPKLKLPPASDPQAWYKLLNSKYELWDSWLTWREQLWTDYFIDLQESVKAIKPDLELGTIETNMAHRGLWNIGMLVKRGNTAHAPTVNWPYWDAYWTTFISRDWYRKRFGFETLGLTMIAWDDLNFEAEQMVSGLYGPIKAGGTKMTVWDDIGPRMKLKFLKPELGKGGMKLADFVQGRIIDCALESPIMDMMTGVRGYELARAMERTAYQISRLPHKDRFNVYERYRGKLPLKFELGWHEDGRKLTAVSKNGTSAGDPHNAVYATVQDWHPNGYTEMLIFNDVEQGYRTRTTKATYKTWRQYLYTFEPGSLRERKLTVTVQGESDLVPFVDGEPWMYFERQGQTLTVKSIPFKAQQVRLLQLARCGRELPHVTDAPLTISHTMLNGDEKILWLKFDKPKAGRIEIYCADWGKPGKVDGAESVDFDATSKRAILTIAPKISSLTINWQ